MYTYFTVYMYSYYCVPDLMNLTRLSPTKANRQESNQTLHCTKHELKGDLTRLTET